MELFTQNLNDDHRGLIIKLNKVKSLGRVSPEAKEILFSSKQILLSHLRKEDEHLYPVLKKAGEKNENIKKIVDSFSQEMETISKNAITFFNKYEKESQGADFSADLENLLATLRNRIHREENILYKMFNEVKSSVS